MIVLYILAYVALIACVAIIVAKMVGYLKKPMHLRWEIYPVAHEAPERLKHGGSYMEELDWWKKPYHSSTLGTLTGFLKEALFLHATYEHNRPLWVRTYPFHVGLYLLIGSLGLTVICSFCLMANYLGWFLQLCATLAMLCNVLGFLGVLWGSLSLIQRRMTQHDLRKYSMPEHFFNLGLFAVFSGLGLIMSIIGPRWFVMQGAVFFAGMLTFKAVPVSAVYVLYLLISFFLFIWVPSSFMGHAFMKYFTWHDIRWDDVPAQDSKKVQAGIAANLNLPVSWKASHIKGDGKKTWAEVATTDPTKQDKE